MPKRIALLGSTGSIGTQTLDVISRHAEEFIVEVLTAGENVDLLIRQALQFKPDSVVIANNNHYELLKDSLAGLPIKVYSGSDAIDQVVSAGNVDMVVASMVGFSGLKPTLSAIRAGKDIALANKETLVVAGHIIQKAVKESGSRIIPVDSEHSAILQCLSGESGNPVEKITLTASGGPFLNVPIDELEHVKPEDALKHPNWDMGCKVTIDSASMMNKGLEVIEAKWLFDMAPMQIDVIIHPQSIIHSFVHFADGSVKAQLGLPDMRIPIQYALSYPDRLTSDFPRMSFSDFDTLTFYKPDLNKFRNLLLAYSALERGGNTPCAMNAANEVAVGAFLKGKISFPRLPDVVEQTIIKVPFSHDLTLEIIYDTDREARSISEEYVNKIKNIK